MKFKEYIELLSESKLTKKQFDKVVGFSPVIPENVWWYEKSVLEWYRGSREDYIEEYGEDKKESIKLDYTNTSLSKEIENIIDSIESIKESVNKSLSWSNTLLLTERNRINSIVTTIEWIKKTISDLPDYSVDIYESKRSINEIIRSYKEQVTSSIWSIKEILKWKANTLHTHIMNEVVWLDKEFQKIKDSIEEKTSIWEVQEALKEFSTTNEIKEYYYNKKEIDSKLSVKKWNTIIQYNGGGTPSWWSSTTYSKLLDLVWQNCSITYNWSNQVLTETYADGTVTTYTYSWGLVQTTVTVFPDDETITATYTYTWSLVTWVTYT